MGKTTGSRVGDVVPKRLKYGKLVRGWGAGTPGAAMARARHACRLIKFRIPADRWRLYPKFGAVNCKRVVVFNPGFWES